MKSNVKYGKLDSLEKSNKSMIIENKTTKQTHHFYKKSINYNKEKQPQNTNSSAAKKSINNKYNQTKYMTLKNSRKSFKSNKILYS